MWTRQYNGGGCHRQAVIFVIRSWLLLAFSVAVVLYPTTTAGMVLSWSPPPATTNHLYPPATTCLDVLLSRRHWTQKILLEGSSLLSFVWTASEEEEEKDQQQQQQQQEQQQQQQQQQEYHQARTPAAAELPLPLRRYTKLAPLGSKANQQQPESSNNKKSLHLSLQEIANRLTQDLTVGATGQGGYILSGDLSTDLFRDDCVFLDPTNQVDTLRQYQKALTIFFDPDRSVIELLGPLSIHPEDRTIRGRFRSRGFLKLPWNPYITAYESNLVYHIANEDGLIYQQTQTWSKSSYEALRETFTPTIYTPPPKSKLVQPPPTEPPLVKRLFEKVNGRRPGEYSAEERREIRQLMNEIIISSSSSSSSSTTTRSNTNSGAKNAAQILQGTWQLVYFEPGPNGGSGGVDRRVPFPEFGFNDQYQVFGQDNAIYQVPVVTTATDDPSSGITNIGQVWGPSLYVRVMGTFHQVDSTTATTSSPARFQADISSGQLCWGGPPTPQPRPATASTTNNDKDKNKNDKNKEKCLDLPIQGVGLFESLYLGERLRILQNLNGTGARGIQVRMA
ncbi:hypothetical protein ACA910_015984 [Epithemia clementina (nom. ined.)]